jgi:hypothetical protein
MASAFHQRSFDDLRPQVQLSDTLTDDNHTTPNANQYQDIQQTNLNSSEIRVQTLDSLLLWLSTH